MKENILEIPPLTSIQQNIEPIIQKISKIYEIGQKDLTTQTNLHLPKLTLLQLNDDEIVIEEISRLAERIKKIRKEFSDFEKPPSIPILFEKTIIDQIEDNQARILHEKFHYIGRFRKESSHLGIFLPDVDRKKLAGIITFSNFDQFHMSKYLPSSLNYDEIMTVSRIYTFDWAPKNFTSHMIGKAINLIKNSNRHIKLLLTYLNPNLGFHGTVYKASNWKVFAQENIQKYAYLDGNYVTLRSLEEDFGSLDVIFLRKHLGNRFSLSEQPIMPLQVYAYPLDKKIGVYIDNLSVIPSIEKRPSIA